MIPQPSAPSLAQLLPTDQEHPLHSLIVSTTPQVLDPCSNFTRGQDLGLFSDEVHGPNQQPSSVGIEEWII